MTDVLIDGAAPANTARPAERVTWRGRYRFVLLLCLTTALFAAALGAAGPAAAAAYPITYTLTNHTNQTLYLDKAYTGGQCQIVANDVVCSGGSYYSKVHPRIVPPGGTAYVDSFIDVFSLRQQFDLKVFFGIGPNAQYGHFDLRSTRYDATCHTFNAAPPNGRHYFCTQNSIRGFDLHQRAAALR